MILWDSWGLYLSHYMHVNWFFHFNFRNSAIFFQLMSQKVETSWWFLYFYWYFFKISATPLYIPEFLRKFPIWCCFSFSKTLIWNLSKKFFFPEKIKILAIPQHYNALPNVNNRGWDRRDKSKHIEPAEITLKNEILSHEPGHMNSSSSISAFLFTLGNAL